MRPVHALLEILRSEGVDRIFGNPGTTELPLLDALSSEPDLPYVLGLHEGAVMAMADGYARATRRPATVSLHVTAGTANGLAGMLNASRSRTPMVVIAGQQDRRHLRHDPMLSGDLVGLARPAVKSAVEVQHAYDLPLALRRAFAEAVRPPAGPTFVAVPMDLLAEPVEVALPDRSPVPELGASPDTPAAAKVLASAGRPAIVAGDGVGRDGAVAELVAVAEALGAAVYPQPMYDRVNFPGRHRLCRPMLPPIAAGIRDRLAGHDVVLVVGCHAFMTYHFTPGEAIPAGVEVVQLDSDPAEVGRNFPVRVGLVGGIASTLRVLADTLRATARRAGPQVPGPAEDDLRRLAVESGGPAPMDPLGAVHAITGSLTPDTVVVDEAGTAGPMLRQLLRPDRPDSYAYTVGGGLGWGIGAAIGTRMGTGRPVVAVLGDGCAAFGLSGLWSAARYTTPVIFVVLDNGEYRSLKENLDRAHSRSTEQYHYVGLDLREPRLDWMAAARTFGVPAVRAGSTDHLADIIRGGRRQDTPLLVHVPVTGHDDRPLPLQWSLPGPD